MAFGRPDDHAAVFVNGVEQAVTCVGDLDGDCDGFGLVCQFWSVPVCGCLIAR